MNKIKFVANRDTNYVFHMLSVAKYGYDNEYGEKYRTRYSQEDLNILKVNENCEKKKPVSAVELYRQALKADI